MKYNELFKWLYSEGFVEVARKGSHVILKHPKHEQKIALPIASSRRELPNHIIKTVSKVIIEAGIVSKEDVENNLLNNDSTLS